jgi:N-acetylglucosamine-6-sulfatase
VANIDIGPTFLAAAGRQPPEQMAGRSFLELAAGKQLAEPWRQSLLYEYYWEYNYPHTPTTFALRGQRYKFIQYHGVWDIDELYDLESDPDERHNLIFSREHQQRIGKMRAELHQMLAAANANQVPFSHKRGMGSNLRLQSGSEPADFPPQLMREHDARR